MVLEFTFTCSGRDAALRIPERAGLANTWPVTASTARLWLSSRESGHSGCPGASGSSLPQRGVSQGWPRRAATWIGPLTPALHLSGLLSSAGISPASGVKVGYSLCPSQTAPWALTAVAWAPGCCSRGPGSSRGRHFSCRSSLALGIPCTPLLAPGPQLQTENSALCP